jgi:hypothetical protein
MGHNNFDFWELEEFSLRKPRPDKYVLVSFR